MTNHPVPSGADPLDLLSATRDLTRRVRSTQRNGWFPLLVLAAVTLAAIPFNRYGDHPIHCQSTHGGGSVCLAYSGLALWYWPVALLGAYLAISWFYVHRSHQRGVGTRVQPYGVVGTVLVLLSTVWALWAHAHPAFAAQTLRIGSSQAGPVLSRIASPAGAIGLALLLLAWIERSRVLLALTSLYLIVTVATVGIGSRPTHPSPWAFLPHLLLSGGVLFVGGIVLALTQRAQGPSTA